MKQFRSEEARWALRQKRIKMWDRPLVSRGLRLRAWLNMIFADHGIFRLFYLNKHRVDARMWRSAQPAPHDITRMAKDGIRTIVNLRGGREHGAWPLERDACERNGITLREFVLRSRELPDRETILNLADFLQSLEYPALAHCKSGADRAGLFSALYVLIVLGGTAAQARKELSVRYGHVRLAKTGVLDVLIDAYEVEGERKGIGFMDWARDVYDPVRIGAEFNANSWASFLVDRLMRRE